MLSLAWNRIVFKLRIDFHFVCFIFRCVFAVVSGRFWLLLLFLLVAFDCVCYRKMRRVSHRLEETAPTIAKYPHLILNYLLYSSCPFCVLCEHVCLFLFVGGVFCLFGEK